MLFTMPEVMFKVVALCFEDVMILVLGFPSGTTGSNQFRNIIFGDAAITNPSIQVKI
jgi:hypothetical protein